MKINQELAIIALVRLNMNGDVLQEKLLVIQEEILRNKKHIVAVHPDWSPQKDARITSLNHFFNLLERIRLQIRMFGELLDDDWWEINGSKIPQQRKKELIVSMEQSIKFGFGMDLFSGIEVSFRMFLRALDPTSAKGATAEFKTIYDCLLGSKQLNFPATERANAQDVLELSRYIRNLIHNGGVYYDKDGQDKEVAYKSKKYHFSHSKVVSFVYWDLLLQLADDLRLLLMQVISHNMIASQKEIIDPRG